MSNCKHEFECRVGVAIFEDKPGNGAIELSGECRHCGVPLVFYGPRGAGTIQPMASVDRLELRAPVTFGYEPVFVPGPDFRIDGPEIVGLGVNRN
jgi:hypothetical protein